MELNNNTYVVFDVLELDKINFLEVMETSAETVRISVDGTKTFVKWKGDVPECVLALETKSEYMNHEQMLNLMAMPEWTPTEGAPDGPTA